MKILLYEHVSSGGYADEPIPASLLSEGYAMLSGLTTDFKAAGHETTVLLDSRIEAFHPPLKADHVVNILASGATDPSMEDAAENCDAAYVVAPEANHVLRSIVECIESTGTLSLNCQVAAIEEAADKISLEHRVFSLGLRFPKTKIFGVADDPQQVVDSVEKELNFPFVVKPTMGAGCSGTSIIHGKQQIEGALHKAQTESSSKKVSIQEFVEGTQASVALISDGLKAVPVSLNLQLLSLQGPDITSSYEGGQVPLDHALRDMAFNAAKRVVESIEGLRGYVGVDLVLSGNEVFVLEINPRLTTSYVGLRRTATFNVADTLARAVTKNELPKNPRHTKYCCFSKVSIKEPNAAVLRQIYRLGFVVAPPFPVSKTEAAYALVTSEGETSEKASAGLIEATMKLQQATAGGMP